jgi:hypothetical protein
MLRRQPPIGGIAFKSGVTQRPFPLKRATGGGIPEVIPDDPSTPVIGGINTATPGRADAHPTHVPKGSYVMPAHIVSMMGEGNTAAGLAMLTKMFLPLKAQAGQQITMMGQHAPYGATGAPYGAQMPGLHMGPGVGIPSPPRAPVQYAGGAVPGQPDEALGTPINISGGEFVIPPDEVKRRGQGNINLGHEVLDRWVNDLQAHHIKTLKRLPGPAK